MRLSITHTKNNTHFYMIKSFRNDAVKNTTKIIECLGRLEEVKEKANGEDPIIWAKKYVAEKTKQENENKGIYFEKLVEGEELDSTQKIYNLGHIFIRKIFEQLELSSLCKEIKKKYKFEYELSEILEDLICTRILYPSSKLSSYEDSKRFLRKPKYELHDVYRALDIIATEKETIEKWCYEKSNNIVKKENITDDGECADKYKLYFNENLEKYESQFDGLYALCVPENMDASIEDILQVSKGRWEIEESFRIMKSEFKSRPVYLHLDERIRAHFVICYLSLLIYRILEKEQLKDKYTTEEIINTLKKMETNKIEGLGYKQLYQKTDITSDLNNIYDFNLDQTFISLKNMKKILKL